jgi:hypothetical protein
MIPNKFVYCSMSARLPRREDPLFEMGVFSIVCMISSAHLTEKLPFLSFALLAWVLLFNFLAFAFFRYSDKLNALCDCFDAPVTDWPPMSLDHFKWVVWNCELRGRAISEEDVVDYYIHVLKKVWVKVNGIPDYNDGYGCLTDTKAPNHINGSLIPKSDYDLIDELIPANPVKLPQSRM